MKRILKKYIPYRLLLFAKVHLNRLQLAGAYMYDLERYLKHSSLTRYTHDRIKLMGTIIRNYHVIEKGLTMPETRTGFGTDRLLKLISECQKYHQSFDRDNQQLLHAVSVIYEYEEFHHIRGHVLSDQVLNAISNLRKTFGSVSMVPQKHMSKEEYFSKRGSAFDVFSNSRSSVRNYSNEEISIDSLVAAIELARNTPSACNRQTSKTYIYSDKSQIAQILELQGGNRGFGHLANKLLLITAELGVFNSVSERHQAYIDGGMYAMNILYGLHFNSVAACILNCSTSPEKDKKLRQLCNIKDSEVFIAMVSCGHPPVDFKIATSKRYEVENVSTIY